MDYEKLIEAALIAREKAYVPYSHFKVGAALITEDGRLFTGCNIENASYGAANCAERTAIFKAMSEGYTTINALAVVGDVENYTYPCGICRQVIAEFSNKDTVVIIAKSKSEYLVKTIKEILPGAFTKDDLIK